MEVEVELRAIGNATGVIIPKKLLTKSNLKGKITLKADEQQIVITKAKNAREGWEEMIIKAGGDDEDLMGDLDNKFDKEEWVW